MTTFNDFLHEQLTDPAFRKEYEALRPEFAKIQAAIDEERQSAVAQTDSAIREAE